MTISLLDVAVAVTLLGVFAVLFNALRKRPQRGVLVLAMTVPFNGLLLLYPNAPELISGWKEALTLITSLAALTSNPSARRRSFQPVPPWLYAFAAYVALCTISALVSYGERGLLALKINFFYALIFFVFWRCPFSYKERRTLVGILMSTATIAALYGIAQQIIGDQTLYRWGYSYNDVIRTTGGRLRSFSTFNQPFPFGLYMSLTILIGTPVAWATRHRTISRAFLCAVPILGIGMLTSIVRAAILGLIAGTLYLALKWRPTVVHVLLLATAGLLIIAPIVLSSRFSYAGSLKERTTGWALTLPEALDAPFGQGVGATGSAADKIAEASLSDNPQKLGEGSAPYQPDNMFVKVAIETGPVGLWLFLMFTAGCVQYATAVSVAAQGQDKVLAFALAATFVAALAAGTVANYLEIFPLDVWFWIGLGVLSSITHDADITRLRSGPTAPAFKPIYGSY